MRRLVSAVVVLACSLSYAQQTPTQKPAAPAKKPAASAPAKAPTGDAARIADVRRLLEITGSRGMVNDMKTSMLEQFKRSSPNLPPEMFNEMITEMKAEDLEEAIIPIYLKHFTASEIKQLIAFYQSPFGKKVTREMPQIFQEANEAGMDWGQNVVIRIATKWHKEGKLTDREYEQLVGPEEQPH
jgi:uncharacterized protein